MFFGNRVCTIFAKHSISFAYKPLDYPKFVSWRNFRGIFRAESSIGASD